MRNLSCNGFKLDKKYIIAALITLLCAIISGIVLFKFININIFFINYAEEYIFYVFNFKNSKLIISHILGELFYIYIFFLIGYFTKLKYLTLILIFIRGFYFTLYTAILIGLNSFGGITVSIFVFIPTSLISLLFCCAVVDICKIINPKYTFFLPLILAVINTIIFIFLINVVFRVIIVIV